MKRVGICFESFGKNVFGGIENTWYNLSLGLISNGVEVFVFTSFLTGEENEFDGIKLYRSSTLPKTLKGDNNLLIKSLLDNKAAIAKDFEKYLSIYKPEAIVVVDPLWGIIQVSEAYKKATIPLFMSYHVANESGVWRQFMEESFTVPYSGYFAVSSTLVDKIHNFFSENVPLIKIKPNPVNVHNFRLSCQVEDYIFCNSRIDLIKNIDTLLEAFALVKNNNKTRLVLCGGDSPFVDNSKTLDEVNSLLDKLGLKHLVTILPPQHWQDIPKLVCQSKLVVLPSGYETFGRSALEALVAGRPLITTTGGNLPDLVGSNGILVEPRNSMALAAAIEKVLANYDVYDKQAREGASQYFKYDNKVVAANFLKQLTTN